MGCGISTESPPVVEVNTVTQNGRAPSHLHPQSAASGRLPGSGKLPDSEEKQREAEESELKKNIDHPSNPAQSDKMAQEEEVIDIDLSDPDVATAALKIQSGFRGHKARKEAKKQKDESELSEELQNLKTNKEGEEELPDLTDPELNKAATKIQASFRGHVVRKTKEDEKEEGEETSQT